MRLTLRELVQFEPKLSKSNQSWLDKESTELAAAPRKIHLYHRLRQGSWRCFSFEVLDGGTSTCSASSGLCTDYSVEVRKTVGQLEAWFQRSGTLFCRFQSFVASGGAFPSQLLQPDFCWYVSHTGQCKHVPGWFQTHLQSSFLFGFSLFQSSWSRSWLRSSLI